jgi:hypothetical protein
MFTDRERDAFLVGMNIGALICIIIWVLSGVMPT